LIYDVAIIGGGVAGLSALMYAGRLELHSVLIAKEMGGTLTLTRDIENYPGFKHIIAKDLTKKLLEHARDYNVEIRQDTVLKIEPNRDMFYIETKKDMIRARAVILATGTERRKLKVPGSSTFENRGIHYCALCDGPLYKGKKVGVIGGSDSAVSEALLLAQYAEKVYIIYRGEMLRPEPINAKRLKQFENIEVILNTNVIEVIGGKRLKKVILDREHNGSSELELDALFVAIGGYPLSELGRHLGVELNEKGEIIIDRDGKTSIRGVFAAGDVVDSSFKQAITAAAEGVRAAYSAYEYITRERVFTCDDPQYLKPIEISAQEVMNKIKSRYKTLVLDVREKEEWIKERIPGSIHIPITELKNNRELLDDAEEIIVYSKDINCPASTIAAKKLIEMGYCNIYDYKGSFADWKSSSFQTEQTEMRDTG
jgi:thioredoxin reductase (NADPH)